MRTTYTNVPASVFAGYGVKRLVHTKDYKRLMERAKKAMKEGGAVVMETTINPDLERDMAAPHVVETSLVKTVIDAGGLYMSALED